MKITLKLVSATKITEEQKRQVAADIQRVLVDSWKGNPEGFSQVLNDMGPDENVKIEVSVF